MLVPESGDAIQTLKAGLMEIADVFVVNKADRPGADRLRTELRMMLQARSGSRRVPQDLADDRAPSLTGELEPEVTGPHTERPGSPWLPPVLTAVAIDGTGIPEILDVLERHHTTISWRRVCLAERRRARLLAKVAEVVDLEIRTRLWGDAATSAWLDTRLAALESGDATPFDVAEEMLRRSGRLLAGEGHDSR